MRKKLAVLFLGAALTVSMLGACGGKDAASSSASAVSASSAADASSASVQDASKAESSTSRRKQRIRAGRRYVYGRLQYRQQYVPCQ